MITRTAILLACVFLSHAADMTLLVQPGQLDWQSSTNGSTPSDLGLMPTQQFYRAVKIEPLSQVITLENKWPNQTTLESTPGQREWIGPNHIPQDLILTNSILLYRTQSIPDQPPILVHAQTRGIKVELTFTHPTATEFSVKIVHQDDGDTQPSVTIIANTHAKAIGPGSWSSDRIRLLGDTNSISVAVKGSTNFSNALIINP